ncbi:hypothetical protein C8R44DRAFT_893618 [Mycena epipterygia]|nr:hypothetical protein C8R44DRAFT_893618 [Mycena epipterygia]
MSIPPAPRPVHPHSTRRTSASASGPHGALLCPGPTHTRSLQVAAVRQTCSFSTAWARWGRGACDANAGDAGCSSAHADPEAPVPMLEAALAVDLSLTPAESRSCAYVYTATLLLTFKWRTLRAPPCTPIRPRGNNKNTNTRARRVCVRLRGGLLLSGDSDDLEGVYRSMSRSGSPHTGWGLGADYDASMV